MNLFETYLRRLKGGPMLGYMASIAYFAVQFCNAHGIPPHETYIAAGAAAAVAGFLYFLNPKALAWVSPDEPTLEERVRLLAQELKGTSDRSPRNFSQPASPPSPPTAVTISQDEADAVRLLLSRFGGGAQ